MSDGIVKHCVRSAAPTGIQYSKIVVKCLRSCLWARSSDAGISSALRVPKWCSPLRVRGKWSRCNYNPVYFGFIKNVSKVNLNVKHVNSFFFAIYSNKNNLLKILFKITIYFDNV